MNIAKSLRTTFLIEHFRWLLLNRDVFQIFMTVLFFENSYRSSHRRCSVKKGVLKKFAKFTGKHLRQRPATLSKKRLWRRCFPVNFAKFLRTPFLQNTPGRLLLQLTVSTLCHRTGS